MKMNDKIKLVQTTSTQPGYEVFRIEAGAIAGVNIPCILAIPKDLKRPSKLMLVFNNETGQTLDESTGIIERDLTGVIDSLQLDLPVIIPILPSQQEFNQSLEEAGIDLHVGDSKQLARECFSNHIPEEHKFYRLDKQVQLLVQNVTGNEEIKSIIQSQRTSNQPLEFSNKLNGFGHSGAGATLLRFSLLQPELFDTLIIGGNGDIIPTPFGENGSKLDYPFGSRDYEELFGRKFPEDKYREINFQFYIGEKEDTNPIYDTIRDENYLAGGTGNNFAPVESAIRYKEIYGKSFFRRFASVMREYEQNGCHVGIKIYKNDCHSVIKSDDLHGILHETSFFDSNCSEQLHDLEMNSFRQTKIEYEKYVSEKGQNNEEMKGAHR